MRFIVQSGSSAFSGSNGQDFLGFLKKMTVFTYYETTFGRFMLKTGLSIRNLMRTNLNNQWEKG